MFRADPGCILWAFLLHLIQLGLPGMLPTEHSITAFRHRLRQRPGCPLDPSLLGWTGERYNGATWACGTGCQLQPASMLTDT